MAELVLFRPREQLRAAENMKMFVELCRTQLTVFGPNLNFDERVWDVTEALALKARSGATRAVFSAWEASTDSAPAMLPEPFCSFAKAYLRYQHGVRPNKSIGMRLTALRATHAALTENGRLGDPLHIDAAVLNRAAQLIKGRYTPGAAYTAGCQLEILAEFMQDHRLTAVPLQWRNPIARPVDGARVGPEFDERRHKKLPSPEALEALAKAFGLVTEPVDVLVSSVCAVLCSAPERINEVLLLSADCEVNQERASGEKTYGLRWWPSKGAEPQVKWIVPTMVDVVREAVSRIRRQTDQARRIARWYEQNPDRLYLPWELENLRSKPLLSMTELGQVLFVGKVARCSVHQWCRWQGVETVKRGRLLFAPFDQVEKAVLTLLPRGFPMANAERDLRYSNALCVIQRGVAHGRKAAYRCAIELLNQGHISTRLGGRWSAGLRSIFERLGFKEKDGRRIHVTTHQFRHYLNTLAQAGGLSQLDIAKWSGRKYIRQNAVYDHVSDRDIVAQVREAIGNEHRMRGPLARLHRATLIPRDEFARLKVPTAHTTDLGYCVHDYTMSPCQLHRDCIHCDELICIKGDPVKAAAIRRQYAETQRLLSDAQEAAAQACAGANRWVEHQHATLERLDQLCKILDDPAVPDGTFIQLSASRGSRLRHENALRLDGPSTGEESV